MSPAAFHLTAAIVALEKKAETLPPFSVQRAGLLEDLEALRCLLKRVTT